MEIQISADKNVHSSDEMVRRLESELESGLSRFTERITRLEVHLSDEIAADSGRSDRRCVIEARPAGHRPVAVTHHAGSVIEACRGAVRKLESVLESKFGRLVHHKGGESIRNPETHGELADRGL